jgi:hypothetical protein
MKRIQLKYIDSPGARPSPEFMSPGELAINRADGVLYYLHTSGEVRFVDTAKINLGAIGLISTESAFPGLTYDQSGGLYVDETVIRAAGFDDQTLEGNLAFEEFPTVIGLATTPTQLINLETLMNADIDQGYF